MARRETQEPELQERVVYINRVSKVVKGGRRMSLTALVVVGDGKGNVGVGMGKSAEVPNAIRKGVEDAKKNMFHVAVTDEGTIPHEVLGEFSAGRVLLKPAVPGTGVIAGGPSRALLELAGITNYTTTNLYFSEYDLSSLAYLLGKDNSSTDEIAKLLEAAKNGNIN